MCSGVRDNKYKYVFKSRPYGHMTPRWEKLYDINDLEYDKINNFVNGKEIVDKELMKKYRDKLITYLDKYSLKLIKNDIGKV